MILQALYALAQRECLVADPDFEPKPVAWLVNVGPCGKLLGITGTHTPEQTNGKKKPKLIPKQFRVPLRPTGKAGIKAPSAFFVENAKYVFGLTTPDKVFSDEEGREKSGWFRDMIAECVKATGDEGAQAVLDLLNRHEDGTARVQLPENCKSNDLFAFVYGPDAEFLVHERPKVQKFWRAKRHQPKAVPARRRKSKEAIDGFPNQCLVTGAEFRGESLFPTIPSVKSQANCRIKAPEFCPGVFARELPVDF